MRASCVLLLLALLLGILFGAYGQGRPVPPGLREAEKREDIFREPPPRLRTKTVDASQLKLQAEELAKLSASVPAQVDLMARGQLPKDLPERLKRIEKLAKNLRYEITH
jgi:hypothetical protein